MTNEEGEEKEKETRQIKQKQPIRTIIR